MTQVYPKVKQALCPLVPSGDQRTPGSLTLPNWLQHVKLDSENGSRMFNRIEA